MQSKSLKTIIIVIAVIVVLAIVSIFAVNLFLKVALDTSLSKAELKSRDSKRKSDIREIAQALELYYSDRGQYPVLNSYESMANSLFSLGYLDEKIQDPLSSQQKYRYGVSRGEMEEGLYFRLDVKLEVKDDKSMKEDKGLYDDRYEVGNALGSNINKVSSTYE